MSWTTIEDVIPGQPVEAHRAREPAGVECVVPGPAPEFGPFDADKAVAPNPPQDRVGERQVRIRRLDEPVGSISPDDVVRVRPAGHVVVIRSAIDPVPTRTAVERIVPLTAVQPVVSVTAVKAVIP